MHHGFKLCLLFLAINLANSEMATTTELCDGNPFIDPTCPNRRFPFRCDVRADGRPCKCDTKCTFYHDCCPDHQELQSGTDDPVLSTDGAQEEVSDMTDWEHAYLPYTSCISLPENHYISNKTVPGDSYHFISKCPSRLSEGASLRSSCENPPTSEDIGMIFEDTFSTPVTAKGIGHFKNIYCALCHNVSLTLAEAWSSLRVCLEGHARPNMTVEELISYRCTDEWEPPPSSHPDMIPRPCIHVEVKDCSDGINQTCPNYLAPVKYNATVYQNLCFAYCNGIGVCTNYLQLCDSYPIFVMGGIGLEELFNFNLLPDMPAVISDMNCNQGEVFDPVTGSCRRTHCLTGFEYNDTSRKCERIHGDDLEKICLAFYYDNAVRNVTSLDSEYLLEIVNNIMIELSLEKLVFSSIVTLPDLSCSLLDTPVNNMVFCDKSFQIEDICRVCFNAESNFTALSQSVVKYNQSTFMSSDFPFCMSLPSFGNVTLEELFIEVPAEWNCESHGSSRIPSENKVSLQPFRVIMKRNHMSYIINVSKIEDICLDNRTLFCETYLHLEANQYEFLSNDSTKSLRIVDTDTVLTPNQFQIQPDGSVVYCLKKLSLSGRSLPGADPLTYAGAILSMISIFMMIATYTIFPALCNLAGKLILSLCVALFLAFLLMCVGQIDFNNKVLCKTVASLSHFFWLSIFFFMNALAIDLNRTFGSRAKVQIASKSQTLFVWYALYGWGTPTLIVGICLFIDLSDFTDLPTIYSSVGLCWLSPGGATLYAFGVPLAALLFLNAIMFLDTVVGLRLTKKATERALKDRSGLEKAREELSLYTKLSGVMGFTWILGFVCDYTNIPELWYIFIAINSLQGVFIFLTFGLNKRIVALWKEKLGVKRDDVNSSSGDTTKSSNVSNKL